MSERAKLPCPLCRSALDIRESVKGKPYTVCDACGAQHFIRKEAGISALKRLLANGGVYANPNADRLRERIRSLENELAQNAAALKSGDQAQKELPKIARQLQDARAELAE